MKKIAAITLLIGVSVLSQPIMAMDQQHLEAMMAKMGEMQRCMAEIDQAQLHALEQRSKGVNEELQALCNSGRRDEAQSKALAYIEEMKDHPEMEKMMKCAEQMKESMGDIPGMPPMPTMELPDAGEGSVCDHL
jgi:hypothetical protein